MKTIYRKEYVSILLFLKSARIKKKLPQEELASLLGKDQTYVSKYESGIRRLDVVEVFDICKALGINMKDIISIMESEI
ncbi:helix-turn-helix domain-containing protein [Escherichia coli]